MLTLLLLLNLVSVLLAFQSTSNNEANLKSPVIGFGAQRLRNFRNHFNILISSGAANACDGIEEYRFSGAIVDNFAPTNSQKVWANGGQRYWYGS